MSFLEKVAKKYLSQYGNRLHNIAFVFPNRRAGLYFNRALQRCKSKKHSIWAPQVFSINDFIIKGLSSTPVPDQLDLIFRLYNIYHERIHHYPREFGEFYPWGKMILADFNEIDKYMVDTDTLFRGLRQFREVEEINREGKAEIYDRYTGFWESLGELYQLFNQRLTQESNAYEGMVYRRIAQQVKEGKPIARMVWDKIVFCGFNALAKSEEVIIKQLVEDDRADILWDMDRYFVDDKNQEAGYFFRKNRETVTQTGTKPGWVENKLAGPRNIDIIGVQSKVSQAKVLGLKLRELLKNSPEPEDIAIVLPDESMLFPVLNSLSDEVEKVNITIGYPLHQTPVFSLFNAIIEMQMQVNNPEQAGKTMSSAVAAGKFYHKDVQRVLNHPYIKPIAPADIAHFTQRIKLNNSVWITEKDVKASTLPEPLKEYFFLRNDSHRLLRFFLDQLLYILRYYEENQPELFDLDLEYMYHFFTLLTRLKDSLDTSGLVLDLFTFRQLFGDIIKNSRIPFSGEPLEGIQIMGMLETQALDFSNLFILSVNEDHLPSGKSHQSFIPYNVRCEMKLPTHEDRDAITAYHFYRLLKNAQNVTLLHTTTGRRIEKSEKSRFIDQLLIEFSDRNPRTTIRQYMANFPPGNQVVRPIVVNKSAAILTLLAKRSYSASALLNYLSCSLRFYFTYILKFEEEEAVAESPDYSLIGTIVHNVLEDLYKPFLASGQPLSYKQIEGLKEKITPALERFYIMNVPGADITIGRNKIVYEVIRKFLTRFFDRERENPGFKILMLEKEIKNIHFRIHAEDKKYTVNLRGIIDRVDQAADGTLRIIDYKTGNVNNLNLNLKNGETLSTYLTGPEAFNKKEIFQLLFYRQLLKLAGKHKEKDFRLGIYPIKELHQGLKYVEINKSSAIDPQLQRQFDDALQIIFNQIMNPEIPFFQTEDQKVCSFCSFKNICSKEVSQPFIS